MRGFTKISLKTKEIWSGRGDLNARPPAPKAGALPGCATPRHHTPMILDYSTKFKCSPHRPDKFLRSPASLVSRPGRTHARLTLEKGQRRPSISRAPSQIS